MRFYKYIKNIYKKKKYIIKYYTHIIYKNNIHIYYNGYSIHDCKKEKSRL